MISASDNSGIKVALNTNVFKYLHKANLNKLAQNKSLLGPSGVDVQGSFVLNYHVHIANLNITNIVNPANVAVSSRHDNNAEYLAVTLSNFEIDLVTDFSIKYGFVSDSGVATPIKIAVSSLFGEYYFNNGEVHFTQFNVNIDKIDIKFNSGLFKVVYFIFKGLIVNKINSEVSRLHDKVEAGLNAFIHNPLLINLGGIIGLNATNVDKPQLVISEATKLKIASAVFLGVPHADIASYLTFGIHGSVYPYAVPDMKPAIPEAVNMTYLASTYGNTISLLISDYTINTLLFMGQQSSMMKKTFNNDTVSGLGFNIDTDGVSNVIPEFKTKHANNTRMEINFGISAINQVQPVIQTTFNGSTLSVSFGAEFNVFNGKHSWDDPDTELSIDVNATIPLSVTNVNNTLSLIFGNATVSAVNVKQDSLKVDQQNLLARVPALLNALTGTIQPLVKDVHALKFISDALNVNFTAFNVNQKNGYFAIGLSEN